MSWGVVGYMIINIGSCNPVKVEALKEILFDYPHLKDALVNPLNVPSEISDQPQSLEETIQGALNRARNAYQGCTYSFGIESGLMKVPLKDSIMDVCVCVIFDGGDHYVGLSSAWEVPKQILQLMFTEGLNMSQAAHKIGVTTNPNVGSAEGLIGIVTKGRLTRKDYTKEAIRAALIHIDVL